VLSNVRQDERSDNEEEEEEEVVSVQGKLHTVQLDVPVILQNGKSKLPVTRRNAGREGEPPQVLANGHTVEPQSQKTQAMPNGKQKHN